MKKALCLLSIAACFGFATSAMAQQGPDATSAPPARVGFQMAIRTGYAIPMGNARGSSPGSVSTNGYPMSDGFSGQVPIFIELGGKITPNFFIGGYLGFGFGGAAGQLDTACKQEGASCTAFGLRFGAEVQYHILPGETANPWVGYGFGFESLAMATSANGQTETDSFGGLEFAHLMGGIDFRLSRTFGIGPFVDMSIGQYSTVHSAVPGLPTQDNDIPNTSTHEWFAFGARGTFFP